jgi:hypothetical protein
MIKVQFKMKRIYIKDIVQDIKKSSGINNDNVIILCAVLWLDTLLKASDKGSLETKQALIKMVNEIKNANIKIYKS